jgi:hypothetical protein
LERTVDDQRSWLYSSIDIGSFEIQNFKYNIHKTENPQLQEELNLIVKNCASVSGKRIFITPNLMNRISLYSSIKPEERKTEVVTKFAFHDIDTIVYHLPSGYFPESFPEATSIQSVFGDYTTTYISEENKIIYIREIKMNKGRFPASSYIDYMNFRKEISKADKAKLVLINKT